MTQNNKAVDKSDLFWNSSAVKNQVYLVLKRDCYFSTKVDYN